jgi:hypothetical protein
MELLYNIILIHTDHFITLVPTIIIILLILINNFSGFELIKSTGSVG